MTPSPALNPQNCPLCGQPNQCAMEVQLATGVQQPPCWCTQVQFSQDLLGKVPEAAQGKACVCSTCAKMENPSPPTGTKP